MFYIQTQDGELPYVYKVYNTFKGAHKAAKTFMEKNPEEGMISVVTGMHATLVNFFREKGQMGFTEEVLDPDNFDVNDGIKETIYHA